MAAIYVRLSYDRHGDALAVERQERECRALADRLGLEVTRTYSDNDLSATSGIRRPGFEALLTDRPDVVIVWHQDRLLRVSKDLERVLDAGFTVHAVTAGMLDLSTPTGRAVARTVTAWATFETEHKAERQRASNRQRATMGRPPAGGPRLFGYTADGLSVVPEEADIIRRSADLLLTSSSMRSLARLWNAEGHWTNRANPWDATAIRRLLANPRIAAIVVYDGQEVGRGEWEPILPEETFRAVQGVLADPGRRKAHDNAARYLLTRIATCGRCGGYVATGHTQHHERVYKCEHGDLARKASDIDAYATAAVLTRLEHPDFRRAFATKDDGPDLAAEADGLRRRLDDLATAYGSGTVTLSQMTTASGILRERLGDVERALSARAGDVLGPLLAVDVRAAWDRMDLAQRRAVVKAVVSSLVLLPPGRGRRPLDPSTVVITWR